MSAALRWDLFCRVVDNFGDAGVAWRLARQLANGDGAKVRLWIDDLASLARLHPGAADADRQIREGVEIFRWGIGLADVTPADVVVDVFGCALPEDYVARMASMPRPPVWIVLEYLSAEPWVAQHHGLPSPHPRLELQRYFFFPGFVEGTGGLLREPDLFTRRDAFGADQRAAFWKSIGYASPSPDAMTVSIFAYESAPLATLLQCWQSGSERIVAAIAQPCAAPVLAHFGVSDVSSGAAVTRGSLEVRIVPFLPQARYDELLWSCDVNFVRGEDSFVRAQWAGRAFVWHAYPQQDAAHGAKLASFLDLYCDSLPEAAHSATDDLMRFWNQIDSAAVAAGCAWSHFAAQRDVLRRHTETWAERLAALGPLAENLASFCQDKIK